MIENSKPKRTVTKRVHHSPEEWAQAKRDYLAGFTASAVSKHYGMSVDAIRKRASKQGWCKAHHVAAREMPPPLHPFPTEAEATQTAPAEFASRWSEIAHPAQHAPGAPWSTWLFQAAAAPAKPARALNGWPRALKQRLGSTRWWGQRSMTCAK